MAQLDDEQVEPEIDHQRVDWFALRPIGIALICLALAVATIAGCQSATSTPGPGDSGASDSGVPVSPSGDGPTATPGDAGSDPCRGAESGAASEARGVIDRADLADEATIEAIEAIRFTDGGVAAASQALAAGVTGDALWAATWIYASSGCDVQVLVPLLSNDDGTIRVMAAAACVAWGRSEGVPVLAALLSEPSQLRGSKPPTSIGDFAAGTLGAYVDGPVIADDAVPEAIAAAWSEWLDAHAASMVYAPETGRWSAP